MDTNVLNSLKVVALLQRKNHLESQVKKVAGPRTEYDDLFDGLETSPIARSIVDVILPPKFTAPKLQDYDGTIDPYEHICHFEQLMQTVSIL